MTKDIQDAINVAKTGIRYKSCYTLAKGHYGQKVANKQLDRVIMYLDARFNVIAGGFYTHYNGQVAN